MMLVPNLFLTQPILLSRDVPIPANRFFFETFNHQIKAKSLAEAIASYLSEDDFRSFINKKSPPRWQNRRELIYNW